MADGRVSGRSVAQDPDVPLGLHVIGRLKLQTDKGMSAARTAQTRVGKASKNTATDGLEQRRQRRWASEHSAVRRHQLSGSHFAAYADGSRYATGTSAGLLLVHTLVLRCQLPCGVERETIVVAYLRIRAPVG